MAVIERGEWAGRCRDARSARRWALCAAGALLMAALQLPVNAWAQPTPSAAVQPASAPPGPAEAPASAAAARKPSPSLSPVPSPSPVPAASAAAGTPSSASTAARSDARQALVAALSAPVPRLNGRLHASDIGLVINTRDPYSVAVGEYYAQRRGLEPRQILHVGLPVKASLSPDEFEQLQSAIDKAFGKDIQALALAWVGPYAVSCNSITGALALGYDEALCRQSCAPSRRSPYANARTARPFTDLKMRPSMLIAAPGIDEAKALIDRGVEADRSLGLRGSLPVQAVYVSSRDAARNVREPLYPREMSLQPAGLQILRAPDMRAVDGDRLLLLQVGLARLPALPEGRWVPGALADHLTSVGGMIMGPNDQSTVLDWIASGVTASHGSVSEPCNHLQKFPNPQWLLLHYLQGATAIEAYWKSVLWPQQSLFVGEPLAAPFARR